MARILQFITRQESPKGWNQRPDIDLHFILGNLAKSESRDESRKYLRVTLNTLFAIGSITSSEWHEITAVLRASELRSVP